MQICWHPMTMWSYTCDMPQYAVKPRFIHNICSIICHYTVSRYWYFKVSITSFFISLMVSSVNRGYHEFWCHKMFSIVNVFHYSDVYSVASLSDMHSLMLMTKLYYGYREINYWPTLFPSLYLPLVCCLSVCWSAVSLFQSAFMWMIYTSFIITERDKHQVLLWRYRWNGTSTAIYCSSLGLKAEVSSIFCADWEKGSTCNLTVESHWHMLQDALCVRYWVSAWLWGIMAISAKHYLWVEHSYHKGNKLCEGFPCLLQLNVKYYTTSCYYV